MKFTGPVCKISRRLGIPLTPKCVKILEKRPYPPGQHGKGRKKTLSDFGIQLQEKQKLKFQFMINEKALRRYFFRAQKFKGVTGTRLLQLLDERLDSTLVRAGVVPTMVAARQIINHKHVAINGQRVVSPGHQVAEGDSITFTDKAKKIPIVAEGLKTGMVSPYVEIDRAAGAVKRLRAPERIEIPVICDEQLVVEFYSR